MTVSFVREFVGYYTSRGPKGYVEAVSKERAIVLARAVAEPWDGMVVEEPVQWWTGVFRVGVRPDG